MEQARVEVATPPDAQGEPERALRGWRVELRHAKRMTMTPSAQESASRRSESLAHGHLSNFVEACATSFA
jgi:hypothetical protein